MKKGLHFKFKYESFNKTTLAKGFILKNTMTKELRVTTIPFLDTKFEGTKGTGNKVAVVFIFVLAVKDIFLQHLVFKSFLAGYLVTASLDEFENLSVSYIPEFILM